MMEMIWRKEPPVLMQIVNAWLKRCRRRPHANVNWKSVCFAQIAWRTCSHDVFPGCQATLGAGDDVIKRKVVSAAAILAREAVT